MPDASRQDPLWRERILVLLLLLVGAGLRLWDMGQAPAGLYHDEAQHGLDALEVLQGNFPLYFPANNGREPLFIYLVTLAVGVLGRSPLAVRLPAFFAGFLTLAATYDLARVLWGRRAGRWALAVIAVTFWHVHLSRIGFRAVLLPLFTALWMAQAVRALKTGRQRHSIAAGVLYGLSWYTYMAARFTPAAIALLVGYGLIWHRERTLQAWRSALTFCLAALIILLPLGIFTLTNQEIVLARTGQVSVLSPEINAGDPWGTLLRHTLKTAGMFFVRGDRIWRHNLAWRPVWGPALGLAFVIGLGVTLARWRQNAAAALALLWTAAMAIPTLLAEDAPHFLRSVGVLPSAVFFPTLGLMWLQDRLARSEKPWARALPAGLLLIALGHTTYDYFVSYAQNPLSYHWFEAGPVALAGEINTLANDGWNGTRYLHGPANAGTIYLEKQLWDSWTTIPFLVPQERVRFLPVNTSSPQSEAQAFIVWPYGEWREKVLPHLHHPAYLSSRSGPQAQGDKDPAPVSIALILEARPRPEVPEPVAYFDGGLLLRAALVAPNTGSVRVQLWWDATSPLNEPYTVFVHYLRNGERIAQDDAQPGSGNLPTTLWQAGDLILDEHLLTGIQPDPARDSLRIGIYHSHLGTGLPRVDENGAPIGDWFESGVILNP